MVIPFAIQDAWISWLLRDAAFGVTASWKALMWVKNITDFGRFCYLNIPCLRINITVILYEFFKRWIDALVGKLRNNDVSVSFRRPYLCPSKGHKHGVSIQSFINLGKTFFRISRIWNIAQTRFLARLFVYSSSFISQILDFLYLKVCIFIFDGVTVTTTDSYRSLRLQLSCRW